MKLQSLGSGEPVEADESVFGRKFDEGAVHRLVVAYRANGRQGTRAQKTRAEVKHSTRKLFKQKGTGRARGGMSSTPIRVGGGRAFPARPDENFTQKVNRKAYRGGMAILLSRLASEGRILVAPSLAQESPKTKLFVEWLRAQGIEGRVLLVDLEVDGNLSLASRNLPGAAAIRLGRLGPTHLLYYDRVVVSEAALRRMEQMWA